MLFLFNELILKKGPINFKFTPPYINPYINSMIDLLKCASFIKIERKNLYESWKTKLG